MIASSTFVAALANIFISQTHAVAVPMAAEKLVLRGGGYPESNPPGVSCYNTWETVTNDPVVQYWYVVASDVGNTIKADRVWNHLNLNGCAPTENKYYANDTINACALTFHTSEACTAARVSNAIRSGSDPGVNIACQFTDKADPSPSQEAASAGNGAITAILEVLKAVSV